MIEFDLQGHEFIELHNLLKCVGLCHSGGMAKLLIADGLARVDGEVELRKRSKVRKGQRVEFQGEEIVLVDR
jgi:ribosome-associated protein